MSLILLSCICCQSQTVVSKLLNTYQRHSFALSILVLSQILRDKNLRGEFTSVFFFFNLIQQCCTSTAYNTYSNYNTNHCLQNSQVKVV